LDQLNSMNFRLEEIQKSLDMYLETKRQIFPRFYFISNDDLLEILGQSKNPMEIQVHLKKCFDNIKSLNMTRVSSTLIVIIVIIIVIIRGIYVSMYVYDIFICQPEETTQYVGWTERAGGH